MPGYISLAAKCARRAPSMVREEQKSVNSSSILYEEYEEYEEQEKPTSLPLARVLCVYMWLYTTIHRIPSRDSGAGYPRASQGQEGIIYSADAFRCGAIFYLYSPIYILIVYFLLYI